jgi:hypothetical protein
MHLEAGMRRPRCHRATKAQASEHMSPTNQKPQWDKLEEVTLGGS